MNSTGLDNDVDDTLITIEITVNDKHECITRFLPASQAFGFVRNLEKQTGMALAALLEDVLSTRVAKDE